MKKLTIPVDVFESERVNSGIRKLVLAGVLKDKPESQVCRVRNAAAGATWRTLRDLELLVAQMYGIYDTQPAISARLREFSKPFQSLVKERRVEKSDSGKYVYFYRLVAVEELSA
ncbi:hypothetical protein R6Y99_08135 [Pseudomonas lundensis]|uniref:hypothetical protein n=1 Tax=Serratia proteamaculans TaxID=28151 RepID=UPI00298225A0|nr:hypothetical protein [Serratia proteamaculans]MDW5499757.1 hypothetical protein [Serratia proteamaculans]MDW5504822.1 hypothetical protein [Pseudomonas lundensis]